MSIAPAPPPPTAVGRRGQPGVPVVAAALGLGGCVLVNLVDPNVDGALGFCPFRVATGGLDCPGCGVLRSTRALTRGQLGTAFDHNVLWPLFVPVLLWALWAWWLHERGRRAHPPTPSMRGLATLTAVLSVFWVVRNLPALEWLASGA